MRILTYLKKLLLEIMLAVLIFLSVLSLKFQLHILVRQFLDCVGVFFFPLPSPRRQVGIFCCHLP